MVPLLVISMSLKMCASCAPSQPIARIIKCPPKTQQVQEQQRVFCRLANGKRHGIYYSWDGSSGKKEQRHYLHGVPHGTWVTRQKNGVVVKKETFLEGKLQNRTSWYEDGSLEEARYYDDGGMETHFEAWYSNGKMRRQGFYYTSLGILQKSGIWREWNSKGTIKLETEYKGGEQVRFSEWHDNGQRRKSGRFAETKDGYIEAGTWSEWYEDGRIRWQKEYGEKKVVEKTWFETGQLRSVVQYENDRRHGILERWSVDDHILAREKYHRGSLKLVFDVDLPPEKKMLECSEGTVLRLREEFGEVVEASCLMAGGFHAGIRHGPYKDLTQPSKIVVGQYSDNKRAGEWKIYLASAPSIAVDIAHYKNGQKHGWSWNHGSGYRYHWNGSERWGVAGYSECLVRHLQMEAGELIESSCIDVARTEAGVVPLHLRYPIGEMASGGLIGNGPVADGQYLYNTNSGVLEPYGPGAKLKYRFLDRDVAYTYRYRNGLAHGWLWSRARGYDYYWRGEKVPLRRLAAWLLGLLGFAYVAAFAPLLRALDRRAVSRKWKSDIEVFYESLRRELVTQDTSSLKHEMRWMQGSQQKAGKLKALLAIRRDEYFQVLVSVSSPQLPPFVVLSHSDEQANRCHSFLEQLAAEELSEVLRLINKPGVLLNGGRLSAQFTTAVRQGPEKMRQQILETVEHFKQAILICRDLEGAAPAWLQNRCDMATTPQEKTGLLKLLCQHYPASQETAAVCQRAAATGSPAERVWGTLFLRRESSLAKECDADTWKELLVVLRKDELDKEAWLEMLFFLQQQQQQEVDNLSLSIFQAALSCSFLAVIHKALLCLKAAGVAPDIGMLATAAARSSSPELVMAVATELGKSADKHAEVLLLEMLAREIRKKPRTTRKEREEILATVAWGLEKVGTVDSVADLKACLVRARTFGLQEAVRDALDSIKAKVGPVDSGSLGLVENPEQGSLSLSSGQGSLSVAQEGGSLGMSEASGLLPVE